MLTVCENSSHIIHWAILASIKIAMSNSVFFTRSGVHFTFVQFKPFLSKTFFSANFLMRCCSGFQECPSYFLCVACYMTFFLQTLSGIIVQFWKLRIQNVNVDRLFPYKRMLKTWILEQFWKMIVDEKCSLNLCQPNL